jgi:hypothetical protein
MAVAAAGAALTVTACGTSSALSPFGTISGIAVMQGICPGASCDVPAIGLSVSVLSGNRSGRLTVDEAGQFSARLLPGSYLMFACGQAESATVTAGGDVHVELRCPPV